MNKQTIMKPVLSLCIAALCVGMAVSSCGESAKERQQRERMDSIEDASVQKRLEYEQLQEYLGIIAEGLDSIAIEEHELLGGNTPGEKEGFNRERMKQDLAHVRALLSRHRTRISELEQQLSESTGDAKKLRTIIVALREQLDAKDRELAQLKQDLEDNRKSLDALRGRVQRMSDEQAAQQQTIQEQQEVIEAQAEQMNNGYVKIATKRELKNAGLLSGGLFKKKKVDYSQIDLTQFQKVNIQTVSSISVPSKIKILTPVPDGSYELVKDGAGGYELHILNPSAFWSVSNFLIIQVD